MGVSDESRDDREPRDDRNLPHDGAYLRPERQTDGCVRIRLGAKGPLLDLRRQGMAHVVTTIYRLTHNDRATRRRKLTCAECNQVARWRGLLCYACRETLR